MDSIRDLKWILNDYFRLRSEEIGKQELSHSLSLSFGPEIERMYKQLEVLSIMVLEYRQYYQITRSIERLLKNNSIISMRHMIFQKIHSLKNSHSNSLNWVMK